MLIAYLVFLFGAMIPLISAASCWRNTVCTGMTQPSFPGIWETYNHSPASRTVSPVSIFSSDAAYVSSWPGPASLQGNGSLLIFDFGQEVGGIVTVTYSASGSGSLGLAFTESKNYTGYSSDDSNGSFGPDGAIYGTFTTTSSGSYVMPDDKLRGGFRYLSLFTNDSDDSTELNITGISLEIAFQPAWSNLKAYGGYFYSNDELINRIWYAGAYTLQTNAVSPTTGRPYPLLASGWENNAYLGSKGSSIFVDGSKRDRAVWSGDLCIAVPSVLVSTGDSDGVKNSLQVQFDGQLSSGEFPMVGPPINFYGSDTYHMSTIIGVHAYVLHTGDTAFLTANWAAFKAALAFIIAKIDSTGLLYVTGTNDWGRVSQGGHNTEANMLMYGSLTTASTVATWANDPGLSSTWAALAATLKAAVNSPSYNWDPSVGAFKDSDTDGSIHPEDGNSMALVFGAANASNVNAVSTQLTTNWGPIGADCPELSGNVVGFVESFEVKGHLAANQATRALDLMRLSWGWYLNNPYGTNSTTPEGYLTDGTWGYRSTSGYDNDPSYVSHAHGWTTGPTDALTSYVVGIQLTGLGGSSWTVSPQFGDLTHAEGGFTTPLGKFSASWTLFPGGYILKYEAPAGTTGLLVLPGVASSSTVLMDGIHKSPQSPTPNSNEPLTTRVYPLQTGSGTLNSPGGKHCVKVTY